MRLDKVGEGPAKTFTSEDRTKFGPLAFIDKSES